MRKNRGKLFLPLSNVREQNQLALVLYLLLLFSEAGRLQFPPHTSSSLLRCVQLLMIRSIFFFMSRVLQVNSTQAVIAPKLCPDCLKRNHPRTIARSSVHTSPEHFSIAVEVSVLNGCGILLTSLWPFSLRGFCCTYFERIFQKRNYPVIVALSVRPFPPKKFCPLSNGFLLCWLKLKRCLHVL